MTRWYEHRFHSITAQRIIFVIIPRVPRLLHPPIAIITALIFFIKGVQFYAIYVQYTDDYVAGPDGH